MDVASLALPEKWDLADRLPEHVAIDNIRSLIVDSLSLALETSKSNDAILINKEVGTIGTIGSIGIIRNISANSVNNINSNNIPNSPNRANKLSSIEFTQGGLGRESEQALIGKIREYSLARLDELGLKDLAGNEAESRGKSIEPTQYVERLETELRVIQQRGFARDFILAHQICDFAHQHDIAIGMGRGSAVGSLTAYLLGIHAVDPVKYDLSFARFLAEDGHNNDRPDFDLDIEAGKKLVVEDYLFSKYPAAAKLEVVAKHGERKTHPAGIVFIDEKIKDEHGIELQHRQAHGHYFPRARLDKEQAAKYNISKLDLLSSKILDRVKAVEEQLENSGHIIDWQKIDWHDQKVFVFLSAGKLEQIYQLSSNYAREIVKQIGGVQSFADLVALQALIRPGAKQVIEEYRVRGIAATEEAKVKEVAGRIDQATNNAKVISLLPELRETRGVILYQEQLMKLAENYLGLTEAESNVFRKELAKLAAARIDGKEKESAASLGRGELSKLAKKDNFVRAVLEYSKQNNNNEKNKDLDKTISRAASKALNKAPSRSLSKEEASYLYDQMLCASKYCFNKSHATAYAMMSFKTAYLETHHGELYKQGSLARDKLNNENNKDKIIKQEVKSPNKDQLINRQQLQHSTAKLAANNKGEYLALLAKGIERVRYYGGNV